MMKRRIAASGKGRFALFLLIAVLTFSLMLSGCALTDLVDGPAGDNTDDNGGDSADGDHSSGGDNTDDNGGDTGTDADNTPSGELRVHFIDIGQGDAILVCNGDEVMLVDTGDTATAHREKLVSYLQDLGISTIDYLVLTHNDADHIGGAERVIRTFDVRVCYMSAEVRTTKTYEGVLSALEDRDVEVRPHSAGERFTVGTADCLMLAPLAEKYTDSNDYSAVIRLTYGKCSVLLTGDAEAKSEQQMLERYTADELRADVLKVGHHGSDTSTCDAMLDAVSPKYAVISCGTGNKYGHPCASTLEKLESKGAAVYRTDLAGTVLLVTDGKTLSFSVEK